MGRSSFLALRTFEIVLLTFLFDDISNGKVKKRKVLGKNHQSVSDGNFPATGGKMFDAIHILSPKFKCKFQYVGMTVKFLCLQNGSHVLRTPSLLLWQHTLTLKWTVFYKHRKNCECCPSHSCHEVSQFVNNSQQMCH